MTYLNLVNNVLRRLREVDVAAVNSTDYSALIGDFVNDALDQVEMAWDWSQLRSTILVSAVDGTNSYSLTGFTDKSKVLYAVNDTQNTELQYQTQAWFERELYLNDAGGNEGPPKYYTFDGVDGNGDAKILVFPTPDASYTLRFKTVLRGTELSADTDTTAIPHKPVIHLALAMAARERGETGGTSAPEYFQIADRYLADAISADAARHPEETIWYPV